MSESIKFHFDVDGENFSSAGEASVIVKKKLRQLGFGFFDKLAYSLT